MPKMTVWRDCRDDGCYGTRYWEDKDDYVHSLKENAWERYCDKWDDREGLVHANMLQSEIHLIHSQYDVNAFLMRNRHRLRRWINMYNRRHCHEFWAGELCLRTSAPIDLQVEVTGYRYIDQRTIAPIVKLYWLDDSHYLGTCLEGIADFLGAGHTSTATTTSQNGQALYAVLEPVAHLQFYGWIDTPFAKVANVLRNQELAVHVLKTGRKDTFSGDATVYDAVSG